MSRRYNVGYDEERNIRFVNKNVAQSHTLKPGIYTLSTLKQSTDVDVVLEKEDEGFIKLPKSYISNGQDRCKRFFENWKRLDKSVGIHFEGQTGSGKTVNLKYLALLAQEEGIPVVVVNNHALLEYALPALATIKNPIVVCIDEIDRMCDLSEDEELLPILEFLDGISVKNILTVMTSNGKLPDVLSKRPGRIRYHMYFTALGEKLYDVVLDQYKLTPKRRKELRSVMSSMGSPSIDQLTSWISESELSPKEDLAALAVDLKISLKWYTRPIDERIQEEQRFRIRIFDKNNKDVTKVFVDGGVLSESSSSSFAGHSSKVTVTEVYADDRGDDKKLLAYIDKEFLQKCDESNPLDDIFIYTHTRSNVTAESADFRLGVDTHDGDETALQGLTARVYFQ